MAERLDSITSDEGSIGTSWSAGGFQARLRERRAAVLEHLEQQLNADVMGEVVFELLVHLALNPETTLDDSLVESFAWRHEVGPADVHMKTLGGQRVHLAELIRDFEKPSSLELVNALLTLGFIRKLSPLEDLDKRSFILRVVGLLPGIERVGPYVITDYIDLMFPEADALRFWQLYTERIGSEVSKRSGAGIDNSEGWLIQQLLMFQLGGVTETRGKAWRTLRRHIKRILRIDRNRSRFVRAFIEGVEDVAALHYVCSSLAMVEDGDVLQALLTRGDEKQISCALFALHIYGELDHVVARVLEHLRSRPLPEIAHRVTEIYAQIHLPPQRKPNLENLRVGILGLVLEKVMAGESIEGMVNAVANDARSLRHGLLMSDLSDDAELCRSPQGQRLLDRAATIFFQSFTPSGIDHVLNDDVFRSAMQKVLRALLIGGGGRVRERLESFGMELSDHVERWTGSEAPEGLKGKLLARFAVDYARTLIGIARSLSSHDDTKELARTIYRTLIRVYLEHHHVVQGDPSFGAVEFALLQLFPDMEGRSVDGIGVGEIIDASHTMAELETALGSYDDLSAGFVGGGKSGQNTLSALLVRKPDRDSPLRAPIEILSRKQGTASNLIRAYLGIDVLVDVKNRMLHALGFRRRGEIILTDREVVVTSERTIGSKVLERSGDSHAIDDLLAVHVRRRLRVFYFALGILALMVAGIVGGHLLFVALRGQEPTLAIVGASVMAFGVVFDAVMSRLSERNEHSVIVELSFKSRPQNFSLSVDTEEGAELLDAFMASDAERRELALMDDWVSRDVGWEPLDNPIDVTQSS